MLVKNQTRTYIIESISKSALSHLVVNHSNSVIVGIRFYCFGEVETAKAFQEL